MKTNQTLLPSFLACILILGLACLLPPRAKALYNIYDCCTSGYLNCIDGDSICSNDYSQCPTCYKQYELCEHSGIYSDYTPPTGAYYPLPDCAAFSDVNILNSSTESFYMFMGATKVTIQSTNKYIAAYEPGFGLITSFSSNAVTKLNSINLSVGLWNGTNAFASATATQAVFYASPLIAMKTYNISNNLGQLPWTTLGNGTNNTTTGLWQMSWTPPTNQSYIVAADVYDPAVTNVYTNNLGVLTTGVASTIGFVFPAPKTPEISQPVAGPSGAFEIIATGQQASNCVFQASSDLKNWSPVVTITNFTGQAKFIGTSDRGNTNRFYRAQFY